MQVWYSGAAIVWEEYDCGGKRLPISARLAPRLSSPGQDKQNIDEWRRPHPEIILRFTSYAYLFSIAIDRIVQQLVLITLSPYCQSWSPVLVFDFCSWCLRTQTQWSPRPVQGLDADTWFSNWAELATSRWTSTLAKRHKTNMQTVYFYIVHLAVLNTKIIKETSPESLNLTELA